MKKVNKTKTKRTYLTPFFSIVLCLCFFMNFTTKVEGATIAPSIFMQSENSNTSDTFVGTQEQRDSEIPPISLPNSVGDSNNASSDSSAQNSDDFTAQEDSVQNDSQQTNDELADDLPDTLPENDALEDDDSLDVLESVEVFAESSVRVTNYAALKKVLEGTTIYSEIQLGSNISMGGGIAVNSVWTNIMINGKDPSTGTIYQITYDGSTTPQGTIYIDNYTTQSITFKNVQISGSNTIQWTLVDAP